MKKILYIPIFSMRSHETGDYDLSCDGNMNRVVTFICERFEKDSVCLVVPNTETISQTHVRMLQEKSENGLFYFVEADYPTNAHASRKEGIVKSTSLYKDLEKETNQECLTTLLSSFDEVYYESEADGLLIEEAKRSSKVLKKLVTHFVCPVSSVGEKDFPPFLKDFYETDKKLAEMCNEILVATPQQELYFKIFSSNVHKIGKFVCKEMIEYTPSFNCFADFYEYENVIYFPFRLSDSGYHFKELCETIKNSPLENNTCIVVSDPNDSLKEFFPPKLPKHIVKVPRDRDVYYTILEYGRVVVPYLEDSCIKHASEDELDILGTKKVIVDRFDEELKIDRQDALTLLENALTKAFSERKRHDLISIEGFDRTGKSTIVKSLKAKAIEYEAPDDLVPYREYPEKFMKQVHRIIGDQMKFCMNSKEDKLVIGRLLQSYYVYNILFNRQVFSMNVEKFVKHVANVKSFTLLFKNYDEYLVRLDELKKAGNADCKVEYTKEEFEKINKLFEEVSDNIIYLPGSLDEASKALQGFLKI